jgi:hypothetical protein
MKWFQIVSTLDNAEAHGIENARGAAKQLLLDNPLASEAHIILDGVIYETFTRLPDGRFHHQLSDRSRSLS